MKKFYLIIATIALLANTAIAANPAVKVQSNKQTVAVKGFVAAPQMSRNAQEVITEQPAGTTLKEMSRKSMSYMSYGFGDPELWTVDYAITTFAEAEDGTLYIYNPIWSYATQSWAKLDKVDDNNYVMHTPQLMFSYVDEYDEYSNASETLVKIKQTFNEDGSVNMALDSDTDIRFTMKDGVLTMEGGDNVVMGLMDINNNWMQVGDYNLSFSTITDELVTITDGQEYFMSYYDAYGQAQASVAKVKIDGSTIFISGIPGVEENVAIKGSIEGDKAIFPTGQFLGHDDIDAYFTYFLPGTIEVFTEEVYDEEWDEWYTETYNIFTPADQLEFQYNAETGNLSTKTLFLVNPGKVASDKAIIVNEPAMDPWTEVAAIPADPIISELSLPTPDGSNWMPYINIKMNIMAADGVTMLNPNKLYYTIFYDDEPYALPSSLYYGLTEDMTEIPFNYTSSDIFVTGEDHSVWLYEYVSDNIGVQAIYYGGGEVRKSNIVYYNQTGINDVVAEKVVESVVYYDLMGRIVTNPDNGLFIKSTTFTDGSVANTKVAF